MQAIMNWLEKYVVPIATKIGSIKWLMALRDGFIATMPITMAGSLSTLLNALLQTYPEQWGWTGFVNAVQPIITIDGTVWNGSLAIFSIYFASMWGYHLAHNYGVDGLSGSLLSVAAFFMSINNTSMVSLTKNISQSAVKVLNDSGAVATNNSVTVNGVFAMGQLNSANLFTAMIFGAIAVSIYIWLMKKDLTIKMPDSVPPAVSKAFAALIPGMISMYAVSLINFLFTKMTGAFFGDWLAKTIQAPLMKAGQGFGMVILVTFLVQIFWFFGIHGSNVLGPVLESIWTPAQNLNIEAMKNHAKIPYQWVRGSFDIYAWFGGAGGTVLLIVAILAFSKRSDEKAVAKLALAPGLFNINEPIMFGLPVVLNAIYFIPFIVAPVVDVTIAYFITQAGWVSPVQVAVPWITPPVLYAFLATNFDWRATLLSIITMVIAFMIWLPFVKVSSKIKVDDE
ncbi:MAG: PTS sugar transporter subunit IIC [Lactobacillaceae bacterium]|nr:PTS sugar transporter subunit IIC [Lactobacillaceae bacterium]